MKERPKYENPLNDDVLYYDGRPWEIVAITKRTSQKGDSLTLTLERLETYYLPDEMEKRGLVPGTVRVFGGPYGV